MDLTRLANLAEIFGVIVIVISLIYVSRQLKQTNLMMRIAAGSERMERDYDLVLPVIESRELADVWIKGGDEFHELPVVDQQRLLLFERRAIVLWHHTFQLDKQGLFPNSHWTEQNWVIRNIGKRQAVREAWKIFKPAFEPDFIEYIEDQFAIADGDGDESR
jgi:hypothetical protein